MDNPVSDNLKVIVTGLKIKGKGIVLYNLEGENGHVIATRMKA